MDIRAVLQEGTSEKTGKKYYFIYLPEIEKKVFLEPCEVKLLTLLHKELTNGQK